MELHKGICLYLHLAFVYSDIFLRQSLMVAPVTVAPVPPRRMRQKKGPKRLKKRVEGHTQPASKEDLDKEMDEYRAEAEAILS